MYTKIHGKKNKLQRNRNNKETEWNERKRIDTESEEGGRESRKVKAVCKGEEEVVQIPSKNEYYVFYEHILHTTKQIYVRMLTLWGI
jgi:hypothetical protein